MFPPDLPSPSPPPSLEDLFLFFAWNVMYFTCWRRSNRAGAEHAADWMRWMATFPNLASPVQLEEEEGVSAAFTMGETSEREVYGPSSVQNSSLH